MRVISLKTVKQFIEGRPEYSDSREPALAWYRQVLRADWASPADVKREIRNASILKDGRVVFNIGSNKYRIVAWITTNGTTGRYTRADDTRPPGRASM